MWVESEDSYLGTRDAEVAPEALIEDGELLEQKLGSERGGNILEGQMVGNDTYADAVAYHEHQRG